jgi:LPXTG-motif cell wall-anchored protein
MALFYLKEITVTGSAPASSLGTVTTPLADPVLADTGFDASIPALGALVALLGGVVIARRRINA